MKKSQNQQCDLLKIILFHTKSHFNNLRCYKTVGNPNFTLQCTAIKSEDVRNFDQHMKNS